MKGKYNPSYIDGRTLKQYYCKDCGKKICYSSWARGTGKCKKCCHKGINNTAYKDGCSTKDYYCKICGKEISYQSAIYGKGRCKKCYRVFNRGKNSPCYIHGKARELYPYRFNNKLRRKIRMRDGFVCVLCGITEKENQRKLSIHHIDYNRNNCDTNNLITLCQSCHSMTNYKRKTWKIILNRKIDSRRRNEV